MEYLSEMKEIFTKSQENLQCHEKLLKKLKKIYGAVPHDEFSNIFTALLQRPLPLADSSCQAVDRIFTFVAKFVSLLMQKEGTNDDTNAEAEADADVDDSDDEVNSFVVALFKYLAEIHHAVDNNVRYGVCNLVSKIFTELGTDGVISEDLFSDVQSMMLERLLDKCPSVRVQAAYALAWLQEPTNTSCPVIQAYLFHLEHDPKAAVRRAILSVIATSSKTLVAILKRIRDVKDTVRKAAYIYLADRVSVRMLTISQRVNLLTQGLNDRSEKVQKAVKTKLLPVWVKFYENDIEKFLHSLDIQGSSEIAEQTLQVLYKTQEPQKLIKDFKYLDQNHLIPLEELTCENAFHWRSLYLYMMSLENSASTDEIDHLICELAPFCEYVNSYLKMQDDSWSIEKKLEHEFISSQLLILLSDYDVIDDVGRKNLQPFVKNFFLLPKLNLSLIKPLVKCFKKVQLQPMLFIHELIEIISEIREPTTVVEKTLNSEVIHGFKMQIANIIVELNILRDQQERCIIKQDFIEAQRLKLKRTELEERKAHLEKSMLPESEEVRIEHNDAETLLRCLTIATEMLRVPKKGMSPPLLSLVETLLLPGIQSEDPLVRNEAVRALGLCCLRDVDTAALHLFLFMEISQMDQETVRITALKSIFDVLMYFGLDAFMAAGGGGGGGGDDDDDDSDDDTPQASASLECLAGNTSQREQEQAASSVLSVLTSMLDSDEPEIRATVAEYTSKLLFLGRIYSPQLFSRLLLMWFNPLNESETYLKHVLGVFFLEFVGGGRPRNIECVEEAFMLTLHTVLKAPPSSPLSRIDEWNLVSFLMHITSPSVAAQRELMQESTVHDRVAMEVCNEILKNPDSTNKHIYFRMLPCFVLSVHSALSDLHVLADKISQVVDDRKCLTYLGKFLNKVEKLMSKRSGKGVSPRKKQPKGAATFSGNVPPEVPSNVTFESAPAAVNAVPDAPLESTAAVNTAPDSPLESMAAVNTAPDSPLESMAAVNTAPDAPLESMAAVNTAPDAPLESTADVNTAPDSPLESMAAVNTAPDALLEPTAAVNTAPDVPLESTAAVNTVADASLESTVAVNTAPDAPLESTSAVNTAANAPLESTAAVNTAPDAPLESSAAMSTAPDAPLESTAAVNTAPDVPLESTADVNAAPDAPLESTAAETEVFSTVGSEEQSSAENVSADVPILCKDATGSSETDQNSETFGNSGESAKVQEGTSANVGKKRNKKIPKSSTSQVVTQSQRTTRLRSRLPAASLHDSYTLESPAGSKPSFQTATGYVLRTKQRRPKNN